MKSQCPHPKSFFLRDKNRCSQTLTSPGLRHSCSHTPCKNSCLPISFSLVKPRLVTVEFGNRDVTEGGGVPSPPPPATLHGTALCRASAMSEDLGEGVRGQRPEARPGDRYWSSTIPPRPWRLRKTGSHQGDTGTPPHGAPPRPPSPRPWGHAGPSGASSRRWPHTRVERQATPSTAPSGCFPAAAPRLGRNLTISRRSRVLPRLRQWREHRAAEAGTPVAPPSSAAGVECAPTSEADGVVRRLPPKIRALHWTHSCRCTTRLLIGY
jgi:hypothetical protein